MRHNLKWFTNRIGKKIYRKKLKCKCWCCQKTEIEIWDGIDKDGNRAMRRENHAMYLHDCQGIYGIKYFDKQVKE